MTSEFFGPLPPSDFNRDAMQRWLDQQVVSFQKIITGSLQADNILSSSNYVAGVSGWMIDGDGKAEFNDVTIRSDFWSANWNGAVPANLASMDTSATAGFYLDSSTGSMQLEGNLYLRHASNGTWIRLDPGGMTFKTNVAADLPGHVHILAGNFVVSGPRSDDLPGFAPTGEIIFDPGGDIQVNGNDLTLDLAGNLNIGGANGLAQVLIPDGSGAAPVLAFTNDTDTGMYRVAANQIGFAIGGTPRFQIDPHLRHAATGGPLLRAGAGDEGFPAFTFHDDSNTGIFRVQPDNLGFSAGGTRFGGGSAAGMYTLSGTTGSAANVHLASGGLSLFQRSTSARKYKSHIDYSLDLASLELKPAKFYREDDDAWYYGFIADDLAEEDPLLGTYDPDTGEIENYDQRAVMAVMAAKINRLESLVLA